MCPVWSATHLPGLHPRETPTCAFNDGGASRVGSESLLHGVTLSKHFIQVQIGGDQAFFLGIGKAVLEQEAAAPGTVLDHAFLVAHAVGFEAWRAQAEATPWAEITAGAGVDEAQIRAVARLYVDAKAVIACWAMGLTQHKHAVVTIQEVVNVMHQRRLAFYDGPPWVDRETPTWAVNDGGTSRVRAVVGSESISAVSRSTTVTRGSIPMREAPTWAFDDCGAVARYALSSCA